MVNVFIDARMSVSPKERSSLWTFWRKDLSRKAMGPFHWLLLENMHEKDWYEYRAGPQDRFLIYQCDTLVQAHRLPVYS